MQVIHRRLMSPLPAILVVLLAGCAATYAPTELRLPDELRGVQSTAHGDVTVSVSILTDDQSRQHFGADLGRVKCRRCGSACATSRPGDCG